MKVVPVARYLARACARCNRYLGVIIREHRRNMLLKAVDGAGLGESI